MLSCFFFLSFFLNSEFTNSSETHLISKSGNMIYLPNSCQFLTTFRKTGHDILWWLIILIIIYLFFIYREHIVHFVEIEYGAWDDKVLNVPNVNYWFIKNATNLSELGAMLEQLLNSWNTTMKNLLIGKLRVHALRIYDQIALNTTCFWGEIDFQFNLLFRKNFVKLLNSYFFPPQN